MNRTRFALAALVAGAFAAVALGQNADKNSAGPTRNDYRLRVVEPAEGGTIAGSTVRVVVNTEIPSEAGDARRDVNSMPRPDVDVFLDGDLKGTMRDAQNVLEIESVSAGAHDLVLLAKNRANEIIDRKSIQFVSTAASAANARSGASDTAPAGTSSNDGAWGLSQKSSAPGSDAAVARNVETAPVTAPAALPARSESTSPSVYVPSAPTLIAQASPPAPPAPRREAAPRTLPETASSDPGLVLAGAGLLLAGLLTRRNA